MDLRPDIDHGRLPTDVRPVGARCRLFGTARRGRRHAGLCACRRSTRRDPATSTSIIALTSLKGSGPRGDMAIRNVGFALLAVGVAALSASSADGKGVRPKLAPVIISGKEV